MAESNQNLKVENPRVIDDPTVREVYANKIVSAQFDGGTVMITLGATRITPNRIDERPDVAGVKPAVHISARLALSPPAAMELINNLNGLLAAVQAAALRASAGTAPPMSGTAH